MTKTENTEKKQELAEHNAFTRWVNPVPET
jgi:hypothetical protein